MSESPEPTDEVPVRKTERVSPEPTAYDHEIARTRREIADRFEREYTEVLKLALGAFGPGWRPSHRHYLVEKEDEEQARRTGGRPKAAATVFTVRHVDDGRARHFTVDAQGKVTECESYEAGFGPLLLEPHPTRGFQHNGQFCRTHRFSLCWAGYELYHPRTAEELAVLRESRERKKAERKDAAFVRDNPLLAQAGIRREDLE